MSTIFLVTHLCLKLMTYVQLSPCLRQQRKCIPELDFRIMIFLQRGVKGQIPYYACFHQLFQPVASSWCIWRAWYRHGCQEVEPISRGQGGLRLDDPLVSDAQQASSASEPHQHCTPARLGWSVASLVLAQWQHQLKPVCEIRGVRRGQTPPKVWGTHAKL